MNKRMLIAAGVVLIIIVMIVAHLKTGGLLLRWDYVNKKKMGYCFDVAVDQTGDMLLAAAGMRGLHIFDLAQGKIKYVSTYYDDGYYRNLQIWEDRAYIADSKRGLVVLEFHGEPETTWVQTDGKAYGIHIKDDKAFVAAREMGLMIFDLTNPDSPTQLGAIETKGYAWDVWVHDGLAYVADFDKGVSVVDVSSPSKPHLVGFVTWADSNPAAEIVRGEGNTIYVAAKNHGLVIIDVSDPAHPEVTSTYQSTHVGVAEGLAVRNGIVYLTVGSHIQMEILGETIWEISTNENGLHIVDTTNPYSPSLISKVIFPGWVEGVHINGDFVYIANTGTGVRSIDIHNPARPVLVDTFNALP